MHARKLILSVALGGPLMGLMLGLAADPDMAALPEPAWRQATPDPIFTQATRPSAAVPVFAMATSGDRVPSWKRRPASRPAENDAQPAPVADPVASEVPEPVTLLIRPDQVPRDEAAEDRDAARSAGAPVESAPQPAVIELSPATAS